MLDRDLLLLKTADETVDAHGYVHVAGPTTDLFLKFAKLWSLTRAGIVEAKLVEADESFITVTAPRTSLCFGDSGSPLLVGSSTSSLRVLGLLSGGDPQCDAADLHMVTPVRLQLAVATTLLLVACSGEEPSAARCEGFDFSGYLDGRWTAPELPAVETVIAPQPGSSIERLWFGRDVPQLAATLWWSAERSELPINYGAAPAANDGSLRDARLVVLIDGVQIDVRDNLGQTRRSLPFHADPGGYGSIELMISGKDVPSGTHTMLVGVIDASTGSVEHGLLQTIIRGGDARFAEKSDHTKSIHLRPLVETVYADSGGRPISLNQPLTTVTADGTLPLRMLIQAADGSACADRPIPIVVTVLVDAEQVALDGFGPFVRVVSDGARCAEVVTHAQGLPVNDGKRHVVTVLLYQGDGLYTEAPPGELIAGNLNGVPITLSRAFY